MGSANLMKWFAILLLSAGLVACEMLADGGIGGTGVSQGPITGFGSIVVNGIHFDVSHAAIEINGETANEELLQPGMVVTIYGDVVDDFSSRARRVVFEYNLKGVVDSILNDGNGFIAQGQTVRIDALTVFQDIHLEYLSVGSPVYVSGVAGSDGMLWARYLSSHQVFIPSPDNIELTGTNGGLKTAGLAVDGIELSGEVSALNSARQRFTLGRQAVNYSQTLFVSMGRDELVNGLPILLAGYLKDGVVMATQIKPHRLETKSGQSIKLHGLVSELNGKGHFKLASQAVTFSTQTQFITGDASDLAKNVELTIDGIVENNAVKAERIEFKPASLIRIATPIEEVQGNELTLAGIPVQVQNTTLMLDSSHMALRRFSAANLAIGDAVVVYGYETTFGVELDRLERVNELVNASITGPIEWVDYSSFGLLGVTVDTSVMAETSAFYQDGRLIATTKSEFLTALRTGDRVTVSGISNASVFTAQQVTLEK